MKNDTNLTGEKLDILAGGLDAGIEIWDRMSENVIGAFRLPLGVLTGLIINGQEHKIAMATEEPSVVAAANRAARIINASGGISVSVPKPWMTAQIMVATSHSDADKLCSDILERKPEWMDLANRCDPQLISHDGGVFDVTVEILPPDPGTSDEDIYIVVTLYVYTADAMGANCLNTMAECILNRIVQDYGDNYQCKRGMAILSNRAQGRVVTARCEAVFDNAEIASGISRASSFARRSPERAVTHNKGILNGVVAAALPLGQDTRALECAAYDFACQTGVHRPLATWIAQDNWLYGELKMPMVVGFAGRFRSIPSIDAAFDFDGIDDYQTLCSVLAGVGLAQNLAALWALSTEGIQAGHMKLHARK